MNKPNVLLICVDHWPAQMIGALGHPTVLTPTIDQFITNGVAFTNAYSTTPMCVPARRELMTGVYARTHGDRNQRSLPLPDIPTLAQTFRDSGYQTYGVGKLHVTPSRDRIGFDDMLLNEEGRMKANRDGQQVDDYEMYLTEQGHAGQEFAHGHSNNYDVKPWHLPEHTHSTNWTARETARSIVRRDPTRPAFWYMSFTAPHPPMNPLPDYLNLYRDMEIDPPYIGEWAQDFDQLPHALKARPRRISSRAFNEAATRQIREAFYALSTHIDHQIRTVIGTLKEEGILDDTIVMFTSDHGDMLGNHGTYTKMCFYEDSTNVPLVLVPTAHLQERLGNDRRDLRLATLADIMPTLLDLCDISIPESVEGQSLVSDAPREHVYGEFYDDPAVATRMIRDQRHKLIYYPVGNVFQLFDLQDDPRELHDLSAEQKYQDVRKKLTTQLIDHLYGADLEWIQDGQLVGLPEMIWRGEIPERNLGGQRGLRFK